MGYQSAFKRNQVEQAIITMLAGTERQPDGPNLRVRLKRLLDADRGLGRVPKAKDPERASYAFYSDEAPGSGVEVWFSSYEAFALLIALRLLAHGWPQGTVVLVMRKIRRELEAEHRRILAQDPSQLFDAQKVLGQAAEGKIGVGNTAPVFLAIASWEKFDGAHRQAQAFAIRRGQDDLMRFIIKEMPVGTATTSLELVNSAHLLKQHLAKTQPSRRGRGT